MKNKILAFSASTIFALVLSANSQAQTNTYDLFVSGSDTAATELAARSGALSDAIDNLAELYMLLDEIAGEGNWEITLDDPEYLTHQAGDIWVCTCYLEGEIEITGNISKDDLLLLQAKGLRRR